MFFEQEPEFPFSEQSNIVPSKKKKKKKHKVPPEHKIEQEEHEIDQEMDDTIYTNEHEQLTEYYDFEPVVECTEYDGTEENVINKINNSIPKKKKKKKHKKDKQDLSNTFQLPEPIIDPQTSNVYLNEQYAEYPEYTNEQENNGEYTQEEYTNYHENYEEYVNENSEHPEYTNEQEHIEVYPEYTNEQDEDEDENPGGWVE